MPRSRVRPECRGSCRFRRCRQSSCRFRHPAWADGPAERDQESPAAGCPGRFRSARLSPAAGSCPNRPARDGPGTACHARAAAGNRAFRATMPKIPHIQSFTCRVSRALQPICGEPTHTNARSVKIAVGVTALSVPQSARRSCRTLRHTRYMRSSRRWARSLPTKAKLCLRQNSKMPPRNRLFAPETPAPVSGTRIVLALVSSFHPMVRNVFRAFPGEEHAVVESR